jgi:hypothetical protein
MTTSARDISVVAIGKVLVVPAVDGPCEFIGYGIDSVVREANNLLVTLSEPVSGNAVVLPSVSTSYMMPAFIWNDARSFYIWCQSKVDANQHVPPMSLVVSDFATK